MCKIFISWEPVISLLQPQSYRVPKEKPENQAENLVAVVLGGWILFSGRESGPIATAMWLSKKAVTVRLS